MDAGFVCTAAGDSTARCGNCEEVATESAPELRDADQRFQKGRYKELT
jgi:hypothetical protein